MRILVTGGSGFIGAHVLKQLVAEGHDVVSFDVSNPSPVAREAEGDVTFLRGDITDPIDVASALDTSNPRRIIHLAGLLGHDCENDPKRAFEVNVGGTFTLLEFARLSGVERVVAASSVSAYGRLTEPNPLDEAAVQRPSNVYGLTKYVVERIGPRYEQRGGFDFTALEPVHGFGPDRVRGNAEDAYVIKAAVHGAELSVPDLDQPIEMIDVRDTARAFVEVVLAEEVEHHRYLVGTGRRASIPDLVEMVRQLVPEAEIRVGSILDDDEFAYHPPTDTSRIRQEFGWSESMTIEESVQSYVDWLQDNPEKWTFDPEAMPWE